jgi:redox-sensitive bicupin YhaK (pirin superfamily)
MLIDSAFGLTSPVATFSGTRYLDIRLDAGCERVLDDLLEEAAIYAVIGELFIEQDATGPVRRGDLTWGQQPRFDRARWHLVC